MTVAGINDIKCLSHEHEHCRLRDPDPGKDRLDTHMNDDLKDGWIDGGCANFILQLGITFLFIGGHKIRFEGKGVK